MSGAMNNLRRWPSSPEFWFIFGLVRFPFLCLFGQLMMWAVLSLLNRERVSPPSGWGGASGIYIGPLLGLLTATVIKEWKGARGSGAFLGAVWCWHLLRCDSFRVAGRFRKRWPVARVDGGPAFVWTVGPH